MSRMKLSKQIVSPVGSYRRVELRAFVWGSFHSPSFPLTVHQYGLFKFSTGNNSRPSTPTASMRSRAAIFGLDVIGRNLFGQGINIKGDLFGSVSSSRRTKSTRSSVYTDGSLARFSRSNSTATAATTISEGDSSLSRSRSTKPGSPKKLIKRKSPAPINPEDELPPLGHSRTRPEPARSRSVDRELTDDDGDGGSEYLDRIPAPDFDKSAVSDDSEWALSQNLELARRNSKSQNQPIPRQRSFLEEPIEETIYEGWWFRSPGSYRADETFDPEEPPASLRCSSRASSKRTYSQRSNTSRTTSSSHTQRPPSPPSRPHSRATSVTSDGRHSRSTSVHSSDRRPLGPRSPSPLPPRTPFIVPDLALPSTDLELALDSAIIDLTNIPVTPTRKSSASSIPRSKRQPFEPTGNTDATPKAILPASGIPRSVEPLAIKKKTSVRSSPGQGRKSSVRNSPLSKPVGKGVSPKRASPRVSKIAQPARTNPVPATPLPAVVERAFKNDDLDKLIKLAESTKLDVSPSDSLDTAYVLMVSA